MNNPSLVTSCCPVCRARFREVSLCPRCGADLKPLMVLEAQAYRQRKAARQFLTAGDAPRALEAANLAQQLHATRQGTILERVCAIVDHCKPRVGD